LPASTDRPIPGPHLLVVRAAFVPNGEQPPPEYMAVFDPLHLPATIDPATGEITCAYAGADLNGDVPAEWHPDTEQGFDDEDGPEQTTPDAGSFDSFA
jgi:hypothetical protein